MANKPLRIGVLTLCLGDEQQLDAGAIPDALRNLIAQGVLDFTASGKPYAASPDEWVPFDDGTSVFAHLTSRLPRFDVFTDSSRLAEGPARRGVKLFVIDALVLLHREKAHLARLIQEQVSNRTDKAVCIIIPQGLPLPFRKDLSDLSRRSFEDLRTMDDPTLVEFEVDTQGRLGDFLFRVSPMLDGRPNFAQIEAAQRVYNSLGVGGQLSGMALPLFGAGPR